MKTHLFIIVMFVFASVFIIVPLEKRSVSAAWYGSGYTYRVQITIDHTKVENHLVNFTMLFNYTSTGFKNHAQADGDDFVFCLNSTGAKLNHEIEAYNSATGYLRAWVNVTGINHVSDVVIDLYYGNATTTSNQNMHGTWDRSYLMVQHLDDAVFGADSTKNHKNMTVSDTDVTIAGKIGSAELYNANADKIYTNATLSAMTTPTYECWVKFSSADGGTADAPMVQPTNDPSILRYTNESLYVYEDGVELGVTAPILANTNWHQIILSFDGTNGNLYLDKVKVKTKAATTSTGTTYAYYLGDNRLGTDTFLGTIDEARISTVARNWSWINTSYNNMNSPSTFYSVSAQNIPDLIVPSAPVYFEALSQNSSWIKLNWTHGATGVDKTVIRANIGSYPTLSVGSTIYNGTLHGYNHTGLTNNTHWFYRCYAWNGTGTGCYNGTNIRDHDTTMGLSIGSINLILHNTTGSYTQTYSSGGTPASSVVTYQETADSYPINDFGVNSIDGDWGTFDTVSINTFKCVYDKPAGVTGAKINFKSKFFSGIAVTHSFMLSDGDFNAHVNDVTVQYCYILDDGTFTAEIIGGSYIYVEVIEANGDFYEENITWYTNTSASYGAAVYSINFTSESQLGHSENIVDAVGTHQNRWNGTSGFWWSWANYTGAGGGSVWVNGSSSVRHNTVYLTTGLFGGAFFGMVLWRRKRRKEG